MPSVHISDVSDFTYTPPSRATGAKRVLLKPNFGYPAAHPVTVSVPVLERVIAGVRGVAPEAEILIVEGVCSKAPLADILDRLGVTRLLAELADPNIRVLDADALPLKTFVNTSPTPFRFREFLAPALLDEVDCRISIGCLKQTVLNDRPLISSAIKNLYGLLPRARYHARSPHARGQLHRPNVHQVITDVYFTLGVLFDGAVVDGTQKFISRGWEPDKGRGEAFGKVIWGDDLPAVDDRARAEAGLPVSEYLGLIGGRR